MSAVIETSPGTLSVQIGTMGDMRNNILMFKKSSLNIASAIASPEVQRQASCVTASNEEEGLAKAAEAFILDEHREIAQKSSGAA